MIRSARRLLFAVMGALAACEEAAPPVHLRIAGGEPEQGRRLIRTYGCGACHRIEGVRGARGTVGPPLTDYAQRKLLAGIAPNTPRALIAWIMDPVAFDPRTGMPAVGVSEAEARHMASYLYTLGASDAEVYPDEPPLELREAARPLRTIPGRSQPDPRASAP